MVDRKSLRLLLNRQAAIRGWIGTCAPSAALEQKHLDAGTTEEAYWHFGYLAALSDAIDLMTQAERKLGTADKPN